MIASKGLAAGRHSAQLSNVSLCAQRRHRPRWQTRRQRSLTDKRRIADKRRRNGEGRGSRLFRRRWRPLGHGGGKWHQRRNSRRKRGRCCGGHFASRTRGSSLTRGSRFCLQIGQRRGSSGRALVAGRDRGRKATRGSEPRWQHRRTERQSCEVSRTLRAPRRQTDASCKQLGQRCNATDLLPRTNRRGKWGGPDARTGLEAGLSRRARQL
jgi:hypothetical protein